MPLKTINIGAAENDGTGTPNREAFRAINENFIYHQGDIDVARASALSAGTRADAAQTTANTAVSAAADAQATADAAVSSAAGAQGSANTAVTAAAAAQGTANTAVTAAAAAQGSATTAVAAAAAAQGTADAAVLAAAAAQGTAEAATDLAGGLKSRVQTLEGIPVAHGQCRFIVVTSTLCRLVPFNGNGLIINGKLYRIPQAGISIANTALPTNDAWAYIYAYDLAGAIALEAVSTNSGHSAGADGIEIKTSDKTRTLVGVAYKNPSGLFQYDGIIRGVSSWFNRYASTASAGVVGVTTGSRDWVLVGNNVWVWSWGRGSITCSFSGIGKNNTGGFGVIIQMRVDGVGRPTLLSHSSIAGAANIFTDVYTMADVSEGQHSLSMYFATDGVGTVSTFDSLQYSSRVEVS